MPVPTENTPANISEVRAEIARIARRLDAESRYVQELLALVDGAGDVDELRARLIGSRGERHAGADVFARMSLGEKLLANLITPETTLFRFSEGELEALDREILPGLRGRTAEILIVPCSHGEEAFTTAAYLLKVGVDFRIHAFDVQPALIDEAKTGRLTFGFPVTRSRSRSTPACARRAPCSSTVFASTSSPHFSPCSKASAPSSFGDARCFEPEDFCSWWARRGAISAARVLKVAI